MLAETVCSCPLPTHLDTKRKLKPVSTLVHFGVRVLNCGWTDTEYQRWITIIGSTALGEPWPPQANVASDLYPGHLPANFYNPVSLRLPLPHQSILLSFPHVLVDLQGLSITSFWIIRRQLMMIGGGDWNSRRKPCLCLNLLATNPILTTMGADPILGGGQSVTKRLRYGASPPTAPRMLDAS
jgi:hypothetical protein